MRLAVVNGPNLNRLGTREPEIYGTTTLEQLDEELIQLGATLGVSVECFQSNSEGALVDFIHQSAERVNGYIVNAAGYTHTSVALRDALIGAERAFVEVHLSNVFAREDFRHRSLLADRAMGVISGFGANSYRLALHVLAAYFRGGRDARM
jgi:3-dehydroquinate dehydratase II